MASTFVLLDIDSGNLVGSYDTLEEAEAIVRDAYDTFGWAGVEDLGLLRIADDGSQAEVATGLDLAHLAVGNVVVVRSPDQPASTSGGRVSSRVAAAAVTRIEGSWHYRFGLPTTPSATGARVHA